MPRGLYQAIQGSEGRQRIPDLNAVVAIFSHWELKRRKKEASEDYTDDGLYDLWATCQYLGPLIGDPDYPDRKTTIVIPRNVFRGVDDQGFPRLVGTEGRTYRLVPGEGHTQRLEGGVLVMERVKLEDDQ